jgi:predicted lipoprotein with Yx(FWY)xxD motif
MRSSSPTEKRSRQAGTVAICSFLVEARAAHPLCPSGRRTLTYFPEKGADVRRTTLALAAIGLVAALVIGIAAASGSSAKSGTVVKTAKTTLGTILVDAKGRTLYMFLKDKAKKSTCSGQCAVYWPPLLTTGKPVAKPSAKAALLGTTKRAGGKLQVTYKGHPLYRYSLDKKAGQTNGEGVNAFGAHWYAVSPSGAKVVKPSSGGGGGYGGGGNGYGGYGP